MTISAASAQHKAESLVGYKKNPNGKHKNLSNIIGEGTSASITIGALLEALETQYDAAKDKSEEGKAKLKKKNDEDREGGDSLREASMNTFRKRKRTQKPAANNDGKTTATLDPDAAPTPTPAATPEALPDSTPTPAPRTAASASRIPTASSSLETLDSDDDQESRKPKRSRRSTSGLDRVAELLQAENARRAEHDKRVAGHLDTFVTAATEEKKEWTSLLKAFLDK
ncbi:hypothetical protein K438DRAFT_1801264 [Mycena galopus ATCC 62051]|nr:hypothetical protein K438DRAFT_1801264 [Mycena galopus ATCC 62051]